MNIILNKLNIENFKGIKSFDADFNGENAVIRAENGIGKTTVYDAFLWLLFGKDSTGRKDFDLRPLDKHNQPLKGLVLAVEAVIDFGGAESVGIHTLRKEQHERVVKKQLRGYETLCWIDDVPKKVSEFSEYIAEIIPEDTFKMLTDLSHFNSKIHWKERRAMLLGIAGDIGTPKGFDDLIASLNGREIEDYKRVLSDQKKRLIDERDEINPRIDEIQRGLDNYADAETADEDTLKENRNRIEVEISSLEEQWRELLKQEKERQEKIEYVSSLTKKKGEREAELASDTSAIQKLFDRKDEIEKEVAGKRNAATEATIAFESKNAEILLKKNQLESKTSIIATIKDEYKKMKETPVENKCFACGASSENWSKEKRKEVKEKRIIGINNIVKRGNKTQAEVEILNRELTALETESRQLLEAVDKANIAAVDARAKADKEIADIDKQIKYSPKPKPEKDMLWLEICDKIKRVEKEIGEPVSEQLQAIDNQRTELNDKLTQINNTLAQSDRIAKDIARIKELQQKEKELAQQIADIEKQLNDIQQYEYAESNLVKAAVNDKFKYVRFKLFNELLNGGLEPCCEATYNGVPYADMSTGQQIICGIDIVNVLSAHYGLSVPLFIDHSESLTLPIEATSQTIKLFAQKNTKKLEIEIEGEKAHARK